MKKISFFLLLLLSIISCRSIDSNANNYQADFQRESDENTFLFTLNYPYSVEKPVIKVVIGNQELFFMCDTAQSNSTLFKSGLEKLFGTLDSFYMTMKDQYIDYKKSKGVSLSGESIKTISRNMEKELQDGSVVFTYTLIFTIAGDDISCPFSIIPSVSPTDKLIDGIIGQDFYSQFKSVLFDYNQRIIAFNVPPITDTSIPMQRDIFGIYRIQFLLNGQNEVGLIDTGSNVFVIRSDFPAPPQNMSEQEQVNLVFNNQPRKTLPKLLSFQEISIGNVTFHDIEGRLGSDRSLKMNVQARNLLSTVNTLGYPFFQGKAIQLDYENSVFRIQ